MRHRLLFGLVGTLSAAVACGGESETSEGVAGGGGQAGAGGAGASEPLGSTLPACPVEVGGVEAPHTDVANGVYFVPVPVELEPYASYPVEDITLCWTGAAVRLGYSLPALLLGKKERVSFEGTYDEANQVFALVGPNGAATCTPSTPAWSCAEDFTDIEVDLEKVAEEVADLDPVEAAARIEVAQRFAVDPIGLLDFPAP